LYEILCLYFLGEAERRASGAANGRSEARAEAIGGRLQALVGLPQLPHAWSQISARL
jgi:hypothetical protein